MPLAWKSSVRAALAHDVFRGSVESAVNRTRRARRAERRRLYVSNANVAMRRSFDRRTGQFPRCWCPRSPANVAGERRLRSHESRDERCTSEPRFSLVAPEDTNESIVSTVD
ncbi:hypothetical protein AAFF_G00180370 [Aldrovandia affinis]|uniref:Uncharacterized protein n=1 Tax=Aldrovandia affinis TaxID=143900 RepID=A0AAD7SY88_9TELE|nr:hypothetical protein AAFF_G00180370 [Aldrovandia affinis]